MFIKLVEPGMRKGDRVTVQFHEGVLHNKVYEISIWLFLNLVYQQKLDVSHLLDKEDQRAENMYEHCRTILRFKKQGKKEGLMNQYTEGDFALLEDLAKHFKKLLQY